MGTEVTGSIYKINVGIRMKIIPSIGIGCTINTCIIYFVAAVPDKRPVTLMLQGELWVRRMYDGRSIGLEL